MNENYISTTFQFRVYAEDTDMMGIVYHANYLRFFERARTEMLRERGVSLTMMASYDTHFAIYEANLKFQSPARLDDQLKMTSRCRRKGFCVLEFEQFIYNEHDEILCSAEISVVCVNSKLKPKRLPNELFQN